MSMLIMRLRRDLRARLCKMDLKYNENLDLELEEEGFAEEKTNNSLILATMFTDERIGNKRGYWLDVPASRVWTFEQSKVTADRANDLIAEATAAMQQLIDDGELTEASFSVELKNRGFVLNGLFIDKYQNRENKQFNI